MHIETELKKLPKTRLVQLVAELYERYGDIDEIIDRYLAIGSTSEDSRASKVQKKILQFKYDTSFIDYYDSGDYAAHLSSLLTDINTFLRDQAPEQALQVTEDFIWLHESVLERADDSDGELGDVFREAVDQWLNIARQVRNLNPRAQNWADKILAFFEGNDYGVLDNCISHSGGLLTTEELTKLAWRFETAAKRALGKAPKDLKKVTPKTNGYNYEAAHAAIGLRSVAEAIGDITLFEKSYLLDSRTLNTLQVEHIVRFAFDLKDLVRAQYWLDATDWQDDQYRFKALRNELLSLQGNIKALKAHLADDFLQNPTEVTLESYWEVANKTERKTLTRQMPELVKSARAPDHAISMALMVEHYNLAEALLVEHGEHLTDLYYGTVLGWLDKLKEKSHPLASVVCYRCLLTNLLERGYSKAYHHGANYFHHLLALDKTVTSYQGLQSAQAYIRSLQQAHWRKRSFWQQADYPSKPS